MPESGYRKRSQSKSNTYTLRQLARYWRLSYRDTVDRLCHPATQMPVFLKTAKLDLEPNQRADLPALARVVSPTGQRSLSLRGHSSLNVIRDILLPTADGGKADDDLLYLAVEGLDLSPLGARRIHWLVKTRRAFRQALRVRVRDVEAYHRRVLQDAKERDRRVRGAKAAAAKRHQEHVEGKVTQLRDEYRNRLQAGEESPAIIRGMARAYAYTVPHLRRLIKPRARKCENVRGR
jgi:hypothetical protein